MATLYEINSEILTLIDEETGEITDLERFEQLTGDRDSKIENIGLWIKNLDADVTAYKAEKLNFASKQARAEKKIESLRRLLEAELNGNKFKTSRVEISFRRSESVKVDDISLIPEQFKRYSEPTPDRAAIKEAIKAGQTIPGAEIESKTNIVIR